MRATIDWNQIGELLYVAPLAGIAVSVLFSLLIVGATRAGDARREGAAGATVAYGTLALLTGLVVAAVVVEGIRIIVVK